MKIQFLWKTETSLSFRIENEWIISDLGVFDTSVCSNQSEIDAYNQAYIYAIENNLDVPEPVEPIYVPQTDYTTFFGWLTDFSTHQEWEPETAFEIAVVNYLASKNS